MKHLKRCPECKKYTLQEMCCKPTELVVPPKYSPEDKYAKYRRKVKYE